MNSKIYIVTLFLFLVGCADTPENRQFWNSFGQAMQGGAQGLQQEANRINSGTQNTQTNQPRTINCYTTTDRYGSTTTCY